MKQVISLDGEWDLHCQIPVAETSVINPDILQGRWKASVPGEVHLDLLRAGVIPDPLYGDNSQHCRWIDEVDWIYQRTFELPEAVVGLPITIQFAGLDTNADISINGIWVGEHHNEFIPFELDISKFLKPGQNEIKIQLDSGLHTAKNKPAMPYNKMPTVGDPTLARMWVRKAQYTFGWDWAPPRFLTCGIWRPVKIVIHDVVSLDNLVVRTIIDSQGRAEVNMEITANNHTTQVQETIIVALLEDVISKVTSQRFTLFPGTNSLKVTLHLDSPRLWWPSPLGEPFLYTAEVKVYDKTNRCCDQHQVNFGIRDVKLDQSLAEDGKPAFRFIVNGVPVFAKGANWAPPDSLLPRAVPERYQDLIRLAVEQNVNCLRVWGGGVYEDPLFYDLCDRNGILVWQDFMFACCYYPDDNPDFCAEIKHEAETIVKFLRHHPSIVLWCGNNENQWLHWQRRQEGNAADRHYGENLYDKILPEVCQRLDPERIYWPSSPFGGEYPNDPNVGDRHFWDVGEPVPPAEKRVAFADYANETGRFISEFGVLSAASSESLSRFLPQEQFKPGSELWIEHQNWFDNGAVDTALKLYYRDPEQLSLEDYCLFSQIIQAEALKFGIEHFRRRKFKCGGAVYWMLADCWGTSTSWAPIDYYLNLKPSYFYVKRAFEDVLLSFVLIENEVEVWLTNDLRQACQGEIEISWINTSTNEWIKDRIAAEVGVNTSLRIANLKMPEQIGESPDQWIMAGIFRQDGKIIARNTLRLAGFNFTNLEVGKATIATEFVSKLEGECELSLISEIYIPMVILSTGENMWIEDNYFPLIPGEERRILVKGKNITSKNVHIRTLIAVPPEKT